MMDNGGRTYDANGRLKSISVPWTDGELRAVPIWTWLIGYPGSAMVLAAIPFAAATSGLKVWCVFAAICAMALVNWCRMLMPKHYPRRIVVHADGRIEFATALVDDGRVRPAGLTVADIQGVEYSPTKQWTTLSETRYVVAELKGEWHDVFALLTNGRRILLARNIWDRDYNHELALLLGDAIREVRDLLKPSPGNASAGASRSAERNRRVVN